MSEKRLELIETAVRLFNRYGFHGTGIDRIAEEAQVSKKTMYHHFRTKEELILAALRHQDGLFRNDFMKEVNKTSDSAYERLLNVFDVAHVWFSEQNFFGCIFINAVGEYAESNEAIRGVCKDSKRLMRDFLRDLAKEAGIVEADRIAETLALMLEGSIVTAQVSQTPEVAQTAKQGAEILIDNALQMQQAEAV